MKKLICLVMVLGFMFGLEVTPEFRGNKLGITYEQLNETAEIYSHETYGDREFYYYVVDFKGYNVYASYVFYKGKLYNGAYLAYDEAMTELASTVISSYNPTKESEGIYSVLSKDKKTKLIASDEINNDGEPYVCVRVFDVATNKQILELERKSKETKL
jgi:hypothetical protein